MADNPIKLKNDGEKVIGFNPDNGNQIPVPFDAVDVESDLTVNSDIKDGNGNAIFDSSEGYVPESIVEGSWVSDSGDTLSGSLDFGGNSATTVDTIELEDKASTGSKWSLQEDSSSGNLLIDSDNLAGDIVKVGDAGDLTLPNGQLTLSGPRPQLAVGSGSPTHEHHVDSSLSYINVTGVDTGVVGYGVDINTTRVASFYEDGVFELPEGPINLSNSDAIQDSGTDAVTFDGSGNVGVPNQLSVTGRFVADGGINLSSSDSIQDNGADAIVFDGNANVTLQNGSLDMNGSSVTDLATGQTSLKWTLDSSLSSGYAVLEFDDTAGSFPTPVKWRADLDANSAFKVTTSGTEQFSVDVSGNVDFSGTVNFDNNHIQNVYSSSTSLSAGDLNVGEIAMDEANGRLVWKDGSGSAYFVNGNSL